MFRKKYLLIIYLFYVLDSLSYAGINSELQIYNFDKSVDPDYYASNGHNFFTVEDRIYILLWDIYDKRTAANSYLLYRDLNEEKWNSIEIEGKAYYLGPKNNNEICSIYQTHDSWIITFHDLTGRKLRSIEHKFQKKKREYHHFIPVPLVYPDGSIIFYTMYSYETRNPVVGFLLSVISGGHGWKPDIEDYIEIIPELVNDIERKDHLSYAKIIDSSYLRSIFPYKDEELSKNIFFNKNESRVNSYDIIEYEYVNNKIELFISNNNLIKVSDVIDVFDQDNETSYSIPLPVTVNQAIDHSGHYNSSATVVNGTRDLIYSFRAEKGPLWIYYYDNKKKEWIKNWIDMEGYLFKHMSLFTWENDLYLSIWNESNRFQVIRCKLESLIHGVMLKK